MRAGIAAACCLTLIAATPSVARAQDGDAATPATPHARAELDDAIVVVAKRYAAHGDRITAAVTALGAADIERRQATHVDDLLREVPGVQVVRDGPAGQTSRVFLRGAASNQTLFLVDGIPQNDATTGGGYDLNDLGTAAVERIEVLRGSYGILYGSEAIGGVVSVTTRRGRDEPGGFIRFEGGPAFDTHRESAGVYGVAGAFDLALTGANFQTHGERAREAYRARDVTARAGYQDADGGLRIDWSGRYVNSRVESPLDFATSGVLPEDHNIVRRRETFSTGLGAVWEADEALTLRGHVSYFAVRSDFTNGPDGAEVVDPDFTPNSGDEVRVRRAELLSTNDEDDVRVRLDGTLRVGDALGWTAHEDGGLGLDVTAGGERLRQESRSSSTFPDFGAPTSSTQRVDETTYTDSLFVEADVVLPDAGPLVAALVTLGARYDDHSEAGSETSRYVGARVRVAPTDTTIRASYGEGFRAPKPSELRDPFVGNPDLRAETSKSREIGLEQRFLGERVAIGVTWFELDVDDLIAFDPSFTTPALPFGGLRNFGRARTRGTELSAVADAGGGFTVRGAYTQQTPEDRETGLDLPNRVRWFGSLGVAWSDGPLLVSLDGYFSRRLHDQGGEFIYPEPSERRRPGEMRLVNLAARWQATDDVTIFARIENLLDDDSVATPSAPAGPPLAVYVGAEWDF